MVEDELGLRIFHGHRETCRPACTLNDGVALPHLTADEAVDLAMRTRDRVIAARLPHDGAPEIVDVVVEPSGDVDTLQAMMAARSWWSEESSEEPGPGRDGAR